MRLSLIFRARGYFYVAIASDRQNVASGDSQALPIKRVGDITVIYHAFPALQEAIAERIDFSFLKDSPLNEESLYQGFYRPLARYIADNHLLPPDEKGAVDDFGCEALFVSGPLAYLFDSRGFTKVANYAAIGQGKDVALASFKSSFTGFSPQDDVDHALIRAGQLLGENVWPILLPNFEEGTYQVLQADGNLKSYPIPFFPDPVAGPLSFPAGKA